jgi:methyl coenzyme M reductase beta subunit
MVKATIKSKTGATIVIEGTEVEVSNIVGVLEKAATIGHAKESIAKSKRVAKADKKRLGAADLVVVLKEEGFFEKPKTLGEISKALEEQGYLYPVTTLSGVVLSLVQKRQLRRKKNGGKWTYGK